MPPVTFEKWEGLGNDFVIVEASEQAWLDGATIRALCDRRRGVGGDGVLFVERGGASSSRMTVFNADGSRPEMCGNGLRCVAAFLAPAQSSSTLEILTDDGLKRCLVARSDDSANVVVEMGKAVIEAKQSFTFDGVSRSFLRINTGNPHAITFEPYDRATLERVGPMVEQAIPGGANVEFASPSPQGIDVVVWERGVGFTLACGTGACAVAVAACHTERAAFGVPIKVTLPGGPLSITVERETLAIRMRGPARRVFRGVFSA